MSDKEKILQEKKQELETPTNKVEIDGNAPKNSSVDHTIKVEGDLVIKPDTPALNLTPEKVEEEKKWDYKNEEGHGIKFNVDTSDPNLSNRQTVEQNLLAKEGLVEKDLKLDIRELSEEEREAINLHNKNAIQGISIDPKVEGAIKHKKENPIGLNAKEMSAERKRKSSLQFDPKNMFNSNKFE